MSQFLQQQTLSDEIFKSPDQMEQFIKFYLMRCGWRPKETGDWELNTGPGQFKLASSLGMALDAQLEINQERAAESTNEYKRRR